MTDVDALAAATPAELACTRCGDDVERGYVAATGGDDPTVHADGALCDVCGWREVGNTGCAPTLSDFDRGDLLVRLEPGSDGLAPASVTERAD